VDLTVYAKAVLLLLRNPAIVVVPLLMAVIGVLLQLVMVPYGGGMGGLTGQLASFIATLLEFFGLGAACIMADDAWRHGRASFDNGWTEARRRAGDILFTALGITFIFGIISYAGMLLSFIAIALMVVAFVFLIWAIPAVAAGGLGGGEAIQVSIDRVRANPVSAALTAVVVALVTFGAATASAILTGYVAVYTGGGLVNGLIGALVQAIADGYIALIITKTYTDASFTRRW